MKATCHCGAIELQITPGQPLDRASRCDCSFCRRRQAAAVMVPLEDLEVVKGADTLTLYQWGTKTARHYFCSVCGIYTHHQRRSDPTQYGVNLGCIDGVNPRDHEPLRWTDGVNHVSDR
ncbi:GFA family protein [Lutimaribacter sp. EGI FJ00015]|uniref:GFA family protein n=1 Tax=Lutimaribacter degradans TaxID=2945989 RepID=A0ACC5ZS76_9RHOB|nr:GFA family protein [Lutimaribacter sp. EGI FJ00013]MCM2560705.1 GFA family protein [Lutimaribacter sp. EGI FJ00013]MCO0612351.1 GFA family protein [Lutimaribacter sp. EGI FJ00015]MCO0634529.1 GFA family protein [Lutimaribacter sp. EGI FJ00014]